MATDHVGSMRERRPGVWQLRVATGLDPVTRRYGSVTATHQGTEASARRALAALVTDVDRKLQGGTSATFGEAFAKWTALLERNGRSATTLRTYRSYYRANIERAFGNVPLRRLTTEHIDDLYGRLLERLAPSSVHQHHAIISGTLEQAVKWRWVPVNVAAIASPPSPAKARVSPPTLAEIRALIARAALRNPVMAVFLWLATTTGARRGELAALRWRNVDLDSATLWIEHAVIDIHGDPSCRTLEKDTKTHAERILSLDQPTVLVLRLHREQMAERGAGPASFIFSQAPDCSEPYRPDRITGFFRRLRKELALEHINLHHLRHFSATQLISAGLDVRTVAGRHGWADPSIMLTTYSHFVQAPDRRAADFMGTLELGKVGA